MTYVIDPLLDQQRDLLDRYSKHGHVLAVCSYFCSVCLFQNISGAVHYSDSRFTPLDSSWQGLHRWLYVSAQYLCLLPPPKKEVMFLVRSVCPSVCLFVCLFVCLSVGLLANL